MKITLLLILLSILFLNTTADAALTPGDLQSIDELIKASETRMKEYVDLKIGIVREEIKTVREEIKTLDAKLTGEIKSVREEIKTLDAKLSGEIKSVDGRVTQIFGFLIALIGLIAVAVGLPQYLLARRGREMQVYMEKIDELGREIEKLKQQSIVSS